MGEFASKGVAGTGLGLGIAGTALGLLNGNAGNGILGGLFGNGVGRLGTGAELQYVSSLQAENAMLKGENYSDKVGKEVYTQALADNRAVEERINALLGPTAKAIAENEKKIAVLEMQIQKDQEINALKIEKCCCETNAKISSVAQAATCGIQQNASAIANLLATVNKITQTVVPTSAICPEVMPRYNNWTAPTTTTPTA